MSQAISAVFREMLDAPIWCAWRLDEVDGRQSKIPYINHRTPARTSERNWLDFSRATSLLALEGFRGNGIGVQLGSIGGDKVLWGIDLDTCRSAITGEIADWAKDILRGFNSYAEISPSGTGVKIFGTFSESVAGLVLEAIQHDPASGLSDLSRFGRQWKRPGSNHPPGIEYYQRDRYFTLTSNALVDYPGLRHFDTPDLFLMLIGTGAPLFCLGELGAKLLRVGNNGSQEVQSRFKKAFSTLTVTSGNDRSGSAYQLRICGAIAASNVFQASEYGDQIIISRDEIVEILSMWPLTSRRVLGSSGQISPNRLNEIHSDIRKTQEAAERSANTITSSVLDSIEDEEDRGRVAQLAQMWPRECGVAIQEHSLGRLRDLVRLRRNEIAEMAIGDKTVVLSALEQAVAQVRKYVDGLLLFDVRKQAPSLTGCPPWQDPTDERSDAMFRQFPRRWSDGDTRSLRRLLVRDGISVAVDVANDAVLSISEEVAIDPVQVKLDGLMAWDGVPRLSSMPLTYFGAVAPSGQEAYFEQVWIVWFTGLIDRVYNPGCQMDYTIVLESKEGIKKSSACRLIGEWAGPYYVDQIYGGLDNKDTGVTAAGAFVFELPEIDVFYKRDRERAKAFLTNRSFIGRLPFGRSDVELPRRGVFIGTSNEQDYHYGLEMRRLMPMWCEGVDLDSLKRDLDQIFAEALHLYRSNGSRPILFDDDAGEGARAAQGDRRIVSHEENALVSFIHGSSYESWCLPELRDALVAAGFRDLPYARTLNEMFRNIGLKRWPNIRDSSPRRRGVDGRVYLRNGEQVRQVIWWVKAEVFDEMDRER